MKTCDNIDCKFYHKDLEKEGLLDTEFENTGEEVEICKWCGSLAYPMRRGGGMSDGLILAVLKTIFGHEGYVTMYETIDDDMIRKDAISIKKLKEFENGDCDYSVRINWRLLERAIEKLEMSKEECTPEEIEHYKKVGAILRSMKKEEECSQQMQKN